MDSDVLEVTNDERVQRYETRIDGVLAHIQYSRTGSRITFLHTEVPPALEGRGVGSALARFALDDARLRGLEVVPLCPFVSAYIRRHPEYLPLVVREHRARLEQADAS